MVSVRRDVLLAVLIPIIYTVGVVAFLLAIPTQSQTLDNFISFFASLSTILMVAVVIVSNSLQRKEMENTRMLQNQPLPSVILSKGSYIEALQFWADYPHDKITLDRRVFFNFSLENIGNGPAVTIDIHPKIEYWDKEGTSHSASLAWLRIGLLKENEKIERELAFNTINDEPSIAECMMTEMLSRSRLPCEGYARAHAMIKLNIFYRNFLGAIFNQTANFKLFLFQEDTEKIKTCLKLFGVARIDYAKDIEKASLLLKSKSEQVHQLFEEMSDKLAKNKGCMKLELAADPEFDTFSIRQISEKKYRNAVQSAVFERLVLPQKSDEEIKDRGIVE